MEESLALMGLGFRVLGLFKCIWDPKPKVGNLKGANFKPLKHT